MGDSAFEIPQQMRDLADQNIKQAHAAYGQLMAFVTKVMDPWTGAMPANPMAAVFKDVQGRAMQIAMENADSAFALWEKIAKAQNFQEALTLQAHFAQDQMQAYATQMQELQRLIGEALQKAQRG